MSGAVELNVAQELIVDTFLYETEKQAMKKILSTLATKIRHTKATVYSSAETIHAQEIFHKLIELERDRVHRNDRQFSLLLIRIKENDNAKPHITKLVETLSKRVRKTDHIGWYDNIHLGVLLTNTTNAGAKVFANDIRKDQNNSEIVIAFETLSYPDKY